MSPGDFSRNMPPKRTVCKNSSSVCQSCRSSHIIPQREREGGKEGKPQCPLPLSPLTCKQASGEREGEKREERLTRFIGLWSINGLHRNSKITPTISTSVVRASEGWAALACVGNMYAFVSLVMSARLQC